MKRSLPEPKTSSGRAAGTYTTPAGVSGAELDFAETRREHEQRDAQHAGHRAYGRNARARLADLRPATVCVPFVPRATRKPPRRHRTVNGKRVDSREAVLQAALGVFSGRGFKGATVREIARVAKVNHGTIRYHFGSKDKLWRAAMSYLFERQAAEMNLDGLAGQGLDDDAFLREAVARYVRYCARHPEHARIALQESIVGGARLRWMAREHVRAVHEVIGAFLRRSMKKGLIREANAISLTYILALASQSVFLLEQEARAVHGVDVFAEEFVEQHVATVLGLLTA